MKIVLEEIKYEQYKWKICGDFKILTTLLGKKNSSEKNFKTRKYHVSLFLVSMGLHRSW